MIISDEIKYIGADDKKIDLFESQYKVPNGMAYNSYVILDDKIAIMDTIEAKFTEEWLNNLNKVLAGRKPDYLIVQHMEPDHSASITSLLKAYPETTIVASAKTFVMIKNFYGEEFVNNRFIVNDGCKLELGKHTLNFIAAPMVHWPEVIVTYESTEKVLFSADAFGKFGANDISEAWDDEARRYYIGIVGKYGPQVQNLLNKAALLDIKTIYPLHGPVLKDNLSHYFELYNTWSSYKPEADGIFIAYSSVYGHTKEAALFLTNKLKELNCRVEAADLARTDMAKNVAEAFRYSKLVLATTTYNADIFPCMKEFINHLLERAFQNRNVAFIENGSWVPLAAKNMRAMLEPCKNIVFTEPVVTIKSALNEDNKQQLSLLAHNLSK